MWSHWVVRASTPYQPFTDFEICRKTWDSLQKTFPQTLAAVLMPNHLHLILPTADNHKQTLSRLGGVIGQISKGNGIRGYWQPIPPPSLIPDKFHLKRQIRYVALNPCRKELCHDPLEWYWSTYRELLGATLQGYPGVQSLAEVLGDSQPNFLDRFHAYVSGDPSVAIAGTIRPQPDHPQTYAYKSIDEILAAAAAALRLSAPSVRSKGPLRPLFVHLAYHHGWNYRTSLLAEICGVSSRAIRFILKKPAPHGMEAAHLCLSDERLRLKRVTLPLSGKRKPKPLGRTHLTSACR